MKRKVGMPQCGQRVVLVEDEPELRDLIRSLLEDEGYAVHAFENGALALAWLLESDQGDVQLVLCDISTPVMSGMEMLRRLRAEGRETVPVVFLSAYTEQERMREARSLGAFDYLVKPFDFGKMLEAVRGGIESLPSAHRVFVRGK